MTFEEIQKYPVGSIIELGEKLIKIEGAWYTDKDMEIITKQQKWFSITFNTNNTYEGYVWVKQEYQIEGWLCDENGWWIVEDSWDGWQIADFDLILQERNKYLKFRSEIKNF